MERLTFSSRAIQGTVASDWVSKARACLTCSGVIAGGRPSRTPRALAAARPSWVPSTIRSAQSLTVRDTWIEEGLRALAADGPDAVRVEALAKKLGVTKGGFYGFFADRDALLTAMLDVWERESTDEVIDRVELVGGDPRAKIQRAGALTFSSDRLLPIDLVSGTGPGATGRSPSA